MNLDPVQRDRLEAFVKDQRTIFDFERLFEVVIALAAGKRPTQYQAANYTIAASESWTVFVATAANVEFILPPTEDGLVYTVVSQVPSAGVGVQVSPVAADKIMGNGFTSLDNKAAINTGATDREGDTITLLGNGTTGWFILGTSGIWAREV